jgi:hypothetical protein
MRIGLAVYGWIDLLYGAPHHHLLIAAPMREPKPPFVVLREA